MRNSEFDAHDVKSKCEQKLSIDFEGKKELKGWFWLNDKKHARISVPKGRKFIPPGTYRSMAEQLKLTVQQFDELLQCDLGLAGYIEIQKTSKLP